MILHDHITFNTTTSTLKGLYFQDTGTKIQGDTNYILIDGDNQVTMIADNNIYLTAGNKVEVNAGNFEVSDGNISATGDISASGMLIAERARFGTDASNSTIPSSTKLHVSGHAVLGSIETAAATINGDTHIVGHVTAVSASFTGGVGVYNGQKLYLDAENSAPYGNDTYLTTDGLNNTIRFYGANNLIAELESTGLEVLGTVTATTGSFHVLKGDTTSATGLEVSGYISATSITASSNISSSGTIVGSNLSGENTGDQTLTGLPYAALLTVNDNYVTNAQLVVIGNTSNTNSGDQNISNLAVTGSDVIFNHITASGDISASGTITADTLTSNNIVFTPGATSIKIEAPDETAGNIEGADLTIESGNGFGSTQNGGNITFQTGRGSGAGDGGNIILQAGGGAPSGSITISSNNLNIDNIGNITASGDISASGTIYSKTPEYFTVGGWLKSSNAAQYYGPHKQGPNNDVWNKSYGTDPAGSMSRLFYNSGIIVPENIAVTGFKATFIPEGVGNSESYTASLYVGQECLNNQVNNPSLVLVQSENVVGPSNAANDNYKGAGVENYDSQHYFVSASSMIYPRFKWSDTTSQFVNLIVQYYRVKI